ncbi:MAG: hypothetical protein H6959_08695 [Chromatiaceae bacterium]|nr:hypothetical protein [Chromatiaceae bacterium]
MTKISDGVGAVLGREDVIVRNAESDGIQRLAGTFATSEREGCSRHA